MVRGGGRGRRAVGPAGHGRPGGGHAGRARSPDRHQDGHHRHRAPGGSGQSASSVTSARSSRSGSWPRRWITTPARLRPPSPTPTAPTTGSPTGTASASTWPRTRTTTRATGHRPISTSRDADALFEEWSRPGIGGRTTPVGPTPYGMREGSHTDPDGNLIRFGSPEEELARPGRIGAAGSGLEVAQPHSFITGHPVRDLTVQVDPGSRPSGPSRAGKCRAGRHAAPCPLPMSARRTVMSPRRCEPAPRRSAPTAQDAR